MKIISLLPILLLIFSFLNLTVWIFEPLWFRTIIGKQPNVKLSYKDFMKYYNLAPQKYEIDNVWKHLVVYRNQYCSRIYIGFNIIDTYKVIYTLKIIGKQEEIAEKQEQKNREMKKYLESVQKDIGNLLDTSEEQINEAKEIINNVTETKITDKKYLDCANASLSHTQLGIGAATMSTTVDWKITEDGRLIRIVE